MIAASEEILNTRANSSQIAISIAPTIQLKATLAAMAVATPLPPRKEKKIGKQWPAKAAIT